jgi:hypothetical protein
MSLHSRINFYYFWLLLFFFFFLLLFEEQQPTSPSPTNDLSKEIASVKAQLLVLVSRLDRLEQEFQTHVS